MSSATFYECVTVPRDPEGLRGDPETEWLLGAKCTNCFARRQDCSLREFVFVEQSCVLTLVQRLIELVPVSKELNYLLCKAIRRLCEEVVLVMAKRLIVVLITDRRSLT